MSYCPLNFDYHSMWTLNFPISQNPKPYSQFSTICLQLASFSKGLSWIHHTFLKTCLPTPRACFQSIWPQPKFAPSPYDWLLTFFLVKHKLNLCANCYSSDILFINMLIDCNLSMEKIWLVEFFVPKTWKKLPFYTMGFVDFHTRFLLRALSLKKNFTFDFLPSPMRAPAFLVLLVFTSLLVVNPTL